MKKPTATYVKRVKSDLKSMPPDAFASKYLFEGIPFIFNGDLDAYISWKAALALRIDIDPRAMAVVGSAALGLSLNPAKNLRLFDEDSDVDVAVVSSRYFELAWYHLRSLGTGILALGPEAQYAVKRHREHLVFDGAIATDSILANLPFADKWVPAMNYMTGIEPTRARDVRFRIYRDFEALRSYQLGSVESSKALLS